MSLNQYSAKYYAHELARSYASDHVGKLAGLLFDAKVEPKPHQIDAALFALKATTLPGVIMADEVGLGKTIEAGIVMSQYWAERKRRILIIAPSSLRQQWKQELGEKFALPANLLDSTTKDTLLSANSAPGVVICSYEFAQRNVVLLSRQWDLVVADEAHRLRSYWSGKAKIAGAVAEIMSGATKKILLTATPLQNHLQELYGLVAVLDPDFFGSLNSFQARYINKGDEYDSDDLTDRVKMIAKRTLRKDANRYIRFTNREPLTVSFTPSSEEQKLYTLVNDYLQRKNLYAFAKSQRQLTTLIIRKRLGSSTYAVAATLENIANRLADEIAMGKVRDNRGGLIDQDLTAEELEDATNNKIDETGVVLDKKAEAKAELEELRGYVELARSITVNQKSIALVEALEKGFAKLKEVGAPQKAIIFTDSTKTQEYIARTLEQAGWGDGLVLFNGTNNSPEATQIYQEWMQRNQGSDLITGVEAADRRKALVDAFRERGTIMIATEAAAEGINLQFCSMLVNYDLPWNPQRVEQRIGRVHRFGQKYNVIVVNFSNKGNPAEERILELLTEKFKLFTSVFGASDEILGNIEDGLDFEKSIAQILDTAKTAEEIAEGFDKLEAQYASEITEEMQRTRNRVFDNLDPSVHDKLKNYDEQTGVVLNAFERLLLALTTYELNDYAVFSNGGTHFKLLSQPASGIQLGNYFFKSAPTPGAHQYRYNSALAEWVIDTAKNHSTPVAELEFSLSSSERVAAPMRNLKGKSGILSVDEVTFTLLAGIQPTVESYLLSVGITDDGEKLDHEQVSQLLDLSATSITPSNVLDSGQLDDLLNAQENTVRSDFEERTANFYFEQESLQQAHRQDLRAEFDARIHEYQKKEKAARIESRKETDAKNKLRLLQEANKWQRKAEEEEDTYRRKRDQFDNQSEDYLTLIQASLEGERERKKLFTIRWKIEE
ncbi:DEAD/DEAH box helicase [Corynebacterium sp. sy017]|uniref:SNF2-related protein n=1 Tax=unclassified Corynebacterium TaxID=2624378 RepID=UPI0011848676|nr:MULTISPECIES: SNF2-related protein [unclassified Corynebacterium]MBP3088489.1 DEAD/DEAH box helicase [Corynebacterium sp. sy017]TSD91794.1 DEAD/DEAH box helicase [Corynebacterium sp. SY003]